MSEHLSKLGEKNIINETQSYELKMCALLVGISTFMH